MIEIVSYQKITSCKSGWNCCKKIRRRGIRNADALKTKTSLMTEDQGLVFVNFDSTIPMAMMETPETWVHSVVWKYLLCVAVLFTFLRLFPLLSVCVHFVHFWVLQAGLICGAIVDCSYCWARIYKFLQQKCIFCNKILYLQYFATQMPYLPNSVLEIH